MSVVGRLWRRAPAFRVCLLVALAGTALAVMFPPHLPAIVTTPHARGADDHATGEQARFTPQPAKPPLDYSSIDLPPLETQRSRLIPFAGRQVPLPAGNWVEVALLRSGGPLAVQAVVLARLRSSRLTGMIVVIGTPPVEPEALRAQPMERCVDASVPMIRDAAPTLHRDQTMRDCWSTSPLSMTALKGTGSQDALVKQSLDRLNTLGVILPADLSTSYYVRAGDHGGLTMRIMLADGGAAGKDRAAGKDGAGVAMDRRTQSWMQRWVPLLRRGFDGALKPAEVTAQAARDPAAGAPS